MATFIQDVLALIDDAFAGVQRDEIGTIHQAQLADATLDREIPDDEWLMAKRRDPEVNWRDVPANSLDECDAALSHATPTSWLFYLPAYMKRALELLNANYMSSNLPNSVIFHLTLDRGSSGLSFYVFERFRQVTPAQDRAIVAFLEYIKGYSTSDTWHSECAEEALDSYWGLPHNDRYRGIEIQSQQRADATKKLPRFPDARKQLIYKTSLSESVQSVLDRLVGFEVLRGCKTLIFRPFG